MRLQSMLQGLGVPADVARAIVRGLDARGIARVREEVDLLADRRSVDHTVEGTESEGEGESDTQSDLDWVAGSPGASVGGDGGGESDGSNGLSEGCSEGSAESESVHSAPASEEPDPEPAVGDKRKRGVTLPTPAVRDAVGASIASGTTCSVASIVSSAEPMPPDKVSEGDKDAMPTLQLNKPFWNAWLPPNKRHANYASGQPKKLELRAFHLWMKVGVQFQFVSFRRVIGKARIQR